MSRIGKQNLNIPADVSLSFDKGILLVKGPKGELFKNMNLDLIKFNISESTVSSEPIRNDKFSKSLWGTYMSHIQNMIEGVTKGFQKKLFIEGVGFKWEVKEDKLQLNVGFSHPVFIKIPTDLTLSIEKGTLTISGINKELVTLFAMQVRKIKPVEPYKGKGIKYENEVVIRKQGKKSA